MGNPEELESIEEVLEDIESQVIVDAINQMLAVFRTVPPEFRRAVLTHVNRLAQVITRQGP